MDFTIGCQLPFFGRPDLQVGRARSSNQLASARPT
jgi:hypothetical protein